jgi:glycosyltransferase involved in cell wall biosynthesis
MPRVSVVIPTYNRANLIGESIRSVLDQTYRDFELIIVDDGSADNTKEVIESIKDPRIRYIYQENRGVSAALNAGIKISTGEFYAGLGSDDLWLPQNLELKVERLDSRPDIALVCSDAYIFDDQTGDIIARFWHSYDSSFNLEEAMKNPFRQMLSWGCFIAGQASVVRRYVFDEVGYFDESLPIEDWDMFVRIVQRFPVDFIDIPLIKGRRHSGNLQMNTEKMYKGSVGSLQKLIRSQTLNEEYLKLAYIRLRRIHIRYAWEKIRMVEDLPLAREKLLTSIRLNPWKTEPYIYFAFSLLGSRALNVIKSWKHRLEGRS